METDSFKLHYEKHIIQKVRSEIYDRYITDEKWDGGGRTADCEFVKETDNTIYGFFYNDEVYP